MKLQNKMVLQYLKDYGSITPHDALREFGILRLSARIHELRNSEELKAQGLRIGSEREKSKNRYGSNVIYSRYFLVKGAAGDN